MTQNTLTGSCLCGKVHYELEGEVDRFYHCHCSRCRKANGTGHASNLLMKTSRAVWTQGEEFVRRYKVPEAERFATCFCTHCGSPLPRLMPERGLAVVPAGTLDTDPPMMPQARIFWDSRADWSCPAGDLPTYAEYPPGT